MPQGQLAGVMSALGKAQGIRPAVSPAAETLESFLTTLAGVFGLGDFVSHDPGPRPAGLSPAQIEHARTGGELLMAAAPFMGAPKALKAVRGTQGAEEAAAAKGIRAFHGSPHDFEAFDVSKAGTTTDAGNMGRGLYFSTDQRVAAPDPHRYEVALNIRNPLEVQAPPDGLLDLSNWKGRVVRDALGAQSVDANELAAALRAQGHDSVVLDYSPTGYHQKEIMVLDDALIDILKKYGLLPAAAAGGYLAHEQQSRPQPGPLAR